MQNAVKDESHFIETYTDLQIVSPNTNHTVGSTVAPALKLKSINVLRRSALSLLLPDVVRLHLCTDTPPPHTHTKVRQEVEIVGHSDASGTSCLFLTAI